LQFRKWHNRAKRLQQTDKEQVGITGIEDTPEERQVIVSRLDE